MNKDLVMALGEASVARASAIHSQQELEVVWQMNEDLKRRIGRRDEALRMALEALNVYESEKKFLDVCRPAIAKIKEVLHD